jgi:hypothetical protein
MRHNSYQTTQQFYINPSSQMEGAVSEMPATDAFKRTSLGGKKIQ